MGAPAILQGRGCGFTQLYASFQPHLPQAVSALALFLHRHLKNLLEKIQVPIHLIYIICCMFHICCHRVKSPFLHFLARSPGNTGTG